MTTWLFPYDSKMYKLDESLEKFGFVEWHQLNKYQVGDILYFYATSPVKKITHMMQVVKIDIETAETIDDSSFLTESYNIKLKSESKNFRMKPIKRFNSNALSANELAKYGLKIKSIFQIKTLVRENFEKCFYL